MLMNAQPPRLPSEASDEDLSLPPPGLPINCQAESSAPTLRSCRANGGLCRPSFPPSRHDWDVHREYFTQLYQDEERPLKEVMEIMKDRHHFHAPYDPHGMEG